MALRYPAGLRRSKLVQVHKASTSSTNSPDTRASIAGLCPLRKKHPPSHHLAAARESNKVNGFEVGQDLSELLLQQTNQRVECGEGGDVAENAVASGRVGPGISPTQNGQILQGSMHVPLVLLHVTLLLEEPRHHEQGFRFHLRGLEELVTINVHVIHDGIFLLRIARILLNDDKRLRDLAQLLAGLHADEPVAADYGHVADGILGILLRAQ
mmetsp:Transcript_36136/g.116888  ORF Transcript_36136/g.116888 Transcript_36136/m.116888 type:complete len:212 (+) Transcript_36136:642-1277(+)